MSGVIFLFRQVTFPRHQLDSWIRFRGDCKKLSIRISSCSVYSVSIPKDHKGKWRLAWQSDLHMTCLVKIAPFYAGHVSWCYSTTIWPSPILLEWQKIYSNLNFLTVTLTRENFSYSTGSLDLTYMGQILRQVLDLNKFPVATPKHQRLWCRTW